MAEFEVTLCATNVYKVTITARDAKSAHKKALHKWREEDYDWNKALCDTTELFVEDIEKVKKNGSAQK